MGSALIWAESLAAALIGLALSTAWSTRGRWIRLLWATAVFVAIAGLAVSITAVAFTVRERVGDIVRTGWFFFCAAWLIAFLILGLSIVRRGFRRPVAGQGRLAASWPRGRLWLGFGGAILLLALTFWNLDLAVRADLAIGRQEAGAMLMSMTPAPIPDSENAARVYAEAVKELEDSTVHYWPDPDVRAWLNAVRYSDWKESVGGMSDIIPEDWKDPFIVNWVEKREHPLALMRKAAAMKRCNFDQPRTLLDAVALPEKLARQLLNMGLDLLSCDARVKAAKGDLPGAFEDVNSMLGMVRHLSGRYGLLTSVEDTAWFTLEAVLRLAPRSNAALPVLAVDDLPPLVRTTREQQALVGMIIPAIASQPSTIMEEIRKKNNTLGVFAIESVCIPLSRILFVPDDLEAMRKLIDDYRKSPEQWRDETPKDWASLRDATRTDRASAFSAYTIKPRQEKLLRDALQLAVLRQDSLAGVAIESFHRKHGKYPERLEELVPEFFPSVPVDPRDGQPLQIKRIRKTSGYPEHPQIKGIYEMIVVYAPADHASAEFVPEFPRNWSRTCFRLSVAAWHIEPAGGNDKKPQDEK